VVKVLSIVCVAAFLLDQGSKYVVLYTLNLPDHLVIDVAPPFLRFVMAWNRGMNFGILASEADLTRWGLVIISIAISVVIFIWARRRADMWFAIGAGLVIGGALGNAIDRVIYGAVADFLNMSCCGIVNPFSFNVADVAIFGGAALLILRSGDPKPTNK
jgi:signal peptidase II